MSALLRLSAAVFVAASFVGGLASLYPNYLVTLGLDLEDLQRSLQLLDAEQERRQRLSHASQDVNHRLGVKLEIARALIERRCTLMEAANRLRGLLDESDPETWDRLRQVEPGTSDGERLCWHIIDWVRAVLVWDDAKVNVECGRLERELRELQAGGLLQDTSCPLSHGVTSAAEVEAASGRRR